ncbi:MAG: tRNA threonylcarbamoyladenosine dehydratase [Paludibacteraceae bacterium]|nr:tRNA threonylcarbamoyladenosine dehydratase [Paludibacteraceae bacterium]
MTESTFSRLELLVGSEPLQTIGSMRVLMFGVGGVGSWCAESLVRSGIRHLTMVDFDRVNPSNINRQLMATTATVGRVKAEVLKERLERINPEAEIVVRADRYTAQTRESFHLEEYDYVIDAIDSVPDKVDLILTCTRTLNARTGQPIGFFSSMGAALKMDPTRIQVAEFWNVKGCPLARALRQHFKREKTFPARKFKCVFSDELLKNQPLTSGEVVKANGTIAHITGIFGFTMASLVIQDILSRGVLKKLSPQEETS